MKKHYGIICSDDFKYIMVTVGFNKGALRVLKVKHFPKRSFFSIGFFSYKPVMLGLPVHWVRSAVKVDMAANFITAHSSGFFIAYSDSTLADMHIKTFTASLNGVCPDDAFLATLPQASGALADASFVSLLINGSQYKIGIIIQGVLQTVFNGPLASVDEVPAILRRIERYWLRDVAAIGFPHELYIVGDAKLSLDGTPFQTHSIPINFSHANFSVETVCKAIGVALAGKTHNVPRFTAQTTPAWLRIGRFGAVTVSFATILLVLLLFAGLALRREHLVSRLDLAEKQYQDILQSTTALQTLARQNDSLATAINALSFKMNHQTNWGRLLDYLGQKKPKGLYFNRFASEAKANNLIRCMLTGEASAELAIAEMTKNLQACPFISNVTLSSMEKNGANNTSYRFVFLCTMQLQK